MSSYSPLNPPLAARDGRVLKCVVVARISTEHQDLKSLDDQAAKCEAYIRDHFGGDVEFRKISSRGSGEFLDREELFRLEQLIESRTIDVVISEDLSRICRRHRAYDFCELCPDYGVRLIAITDRIDTAVDGWQDSAHIATWHHERSNRDTAERIRRTLNHRFDQGGVVQFTIYGYIKPPGAKSDQDLQKDPEAEPIIREIFRRLEQGASYAEVADWLNERGVPPGPYCRRTRWSRTTVSQFVHQPILKGRRERNRKVSRRENKTGRHKTVKGTPQQLRVRDCPHLAFLDPAYYDHVIQLLDARNAGRCRTANGQPDPRQNVPRKRTAFPGQHALCGICGRLMHWHSTKRLKYLLCSGAAEYRCWNAMYVPGPECAAAIAEAVIQALADMPDFDAVFGELVRRRLADFEGQRAEVREKCERQLRDVSQRLAKLMTVLETAKSSETLLARLKELEQEQSSIRYSLQQLDQEPSRCLKRSNSDSKRLRPCVTCR
jgi:DNA invertase Pin-like site-specific DNA recombinase